jgi:hypothetical protein
MGEASFMGRSPKRSRPVVTGARAVGGSDQPTQ